MPTQHPQEDTQPAQIRELVSKYCRLDYEGATLDPKLWPRIQPLVWWKSLPEYTRIDVIARYTVDPDPSLNHNKYTAEVHYRLLGTFDMTTGYAPEPHVSNQDVAFVTSLDNTEWRISSDENTVPHPSRTAMLKWLGEKISTTADEATKARYQSALDQLKAQSASPFAR